MNGSIPMCGRRQGAPWALFPVLILWAGLPLDPGQPPERRDQESSTVLGPGWHEPGAYPVDCGNTQDPPDAVALTHGLADRPPEIGERGRITTIITSVRRKDRDGKAIGPSFVGPTEDGKGCEVVLQKAGTYLVETETSISNWRWVRAEEASSVSVERARTEPLTDNIRTTTYSIFVRGDCSADELAPPAPVDPDPIRDHLREAFIQALSVRSPGVDGNSVSIEPLESGGLWSFAVRLGRNGCVLPSVDSMADCSSPMLGPTAHLLLGSLQQAGGWSRVNARLVDPYTSVVTRAARGDARGSSTDSLERALSDALNGLTFPWTCGGLQ